MAKTPSWSHADERRALVFTSEDYQEGVNALRALQDDGYVFRMRS